MVVVVLMSDQCRRSQMPPVNTTAIAQHSGEYKVHGSNTGTIAASAEPLEIGEP